MKTLQEVFNEKVTSIIAAKPDCVVNGKTGKCGWTQGDSLNVIAGMMVALCETPKDKQRQAEFLALTNSIVNVSAFRQKKEKAGELIPQEGKKQLSTDAFMAMLENA